MASYDTRGSAPVAGIRNRAGPFLATRSSGKPAVTTYYQRARRVSTGALVYWSVTGAPDTTGASSGYAGDVTDVVILSVQTR